MKKFTLSVYQYRQHLERELGYADEELVRRYAEARSAYKRGEYFNPFTDDPKCKTCKKLRRK